MAGENLASCTCPHCGEPAPVRKVKNSDLLYLACKCGTHKSSSAAFQERLQNAVAGIPEISDTEKPENSGNSETEWSPTIHTQRTAGVALPESAGQQSETEQPEKKGGTLKKVAGFGLLALALAGLAVKTLGKGVRV